MFDWLFVSLKELHEKEYQKRQEGVAEALAAQDAEARQKRLQQVAEMAAETIDRANELAADGDPHKKTLAARIKDAAVGVAQRAEPLSAEERRANEADPLSVSSSGSSPPSESILPSSTTPKALPPSTEPPKRGRGRPPKHKG